DSEARGFGAPGTNDSAKWQWQESVEPRSPGVASPSQPLGLGRRGWSALVLTTLVVLAVGGTLVVRSSRATRANSVPPVAGPAPAASEVRERVGQPARAQLPAPEIVPAGAEPPLQ